MSHQPYARPPVATLVRAKLIPPRPGPWVRRPRLTEAAAPGAGQVLAVIAGPGWGKTALLRQLAAESAMPAAWVRVDELDTDPVTFARHLLAAIGQASDRVLERAAQALAQYDGDAADAPAGVAAALAEDLARQRRGTVLLVLDDLHRLPPGAPALQLLERLVSYAAGDLALAVAGRAYPALPIARWIAEGIARAVTAADLRFTGAEAADLASSIYQLRCSSPEVVRLLRLSGGWPVALNLLLEQRQRGLAPTGEPESERLLQYLVQEAQALPGPLRQTLLYAGLMHRLDPDICRELAGAGAAPLGELAALGFLVQRAPGRYTHEAVFRPLLQEWARRQLGPAGMRDAHRQAAAACLARGDAAGAVDQLALLGDTEQAWHLAEQTIRASHDLPCLTGVDDGTLELLLQAPPDRPWIHLNNAFLLLRAGRLSEALSTASRAESRFRHVETTGRAAAALLQARILALMHRVPDAVEIVERLEPPGAERPLLHAHRLAVMALLYHMAGEAQRGDSYLAQVVAAARTAASPQVTLQAFSDVALRVYYARGDFSAALRHCRWLQAEVAGEVAAVSLTARSLTALALVRAGRATEALPLARDLLADCTRNGVAGGRVLALTAAAAAEGCLGRADEGAQMAAVAAGEALAHRDAGTRALVLDWAARLQRWAGDAAGAVETAALLYHQVTGPGSPPAFAAAAAAGLVLAHLAAGDATAAALVLAEADPICPSQAAYYRLKLDLAAALLDSDVDAAAARARRAARQLGDARFAWLERYENEWVQAALTRTGARGGGRGRRAAWSAGGGAGGPAAGGPGGPGGVHLGATMPATPALASLSEREEEILRLMLRGAGNREIAQRLYISEGTVKSHVSSIFQKLGVHSRTQAVLLALQSYRGQPV